MLVEENKAIVRRGYEELNKKNLAALDEDYAADFVMHVPGGVEIHGPEGLKQLVTTLLTAFPDHHETVDDLIAEGDKVVARVKWTGTHQGEWLGIGPTGKQVTLRGITIYRITGGKITEIWQEVDMLGLMQQLGAIPAPGQG